MGLGLGLGPRGCAVDVDVLARALRHGDGDVAGERYGRLAHEAAHLVWVRVRVRVRVSVWVWVWVRVGEG